MEWSKLFYLHCDVSIWQTGDLCVHVQTMSRMSQTLNMLSNNRKVAVAYCLLFLPFTYNNQQTFHVTYTNKRFVTTLIHSNWATTKLVTIIYMYTSWPNQTETKKYPHTQIVQVLRQVHNIHTSEQSVIAYIALQPEVHTKWFGHALQRLNRIPALWWVQFT